MDSDNDNKTEVPMYVSTFLWITKSVTHYDWFRCEEAMFNQLTLISNFVISTFLRWKQYRNYQVNNFFFIKNKNKILSQVSLELILALKFIPCN